MIRTLIVLVLLCIGIALQIFLSTQKNKWLGLILPAACMVFSILAALSVPNYASYTTEGSLFGTAMKAAAVTIFIICNIPTLILGGIYIGCRENNKKSYSDRR